VGRAKEERQRGSGDEGREGGRERGKKGGREGEGGRREGGCTYSWCTEVRNHQELVHQMETPHQQISQFVIVLNNIFDTQLQRAIQDDKFRCLIRFMQFMVHAIYDSCNLWFIQSEPFTVEGCRYYYAIRNIYYVSAQCMPHTRA